MIGQLTVNISAKDPTRKCETFRAFVGSPSNVRIVGVPSSLGNWKIQTVYFTVNYPDNRSVGKTCKAGVGVYVATIEGSTIPGKSLLGYTVKADGVDENNQPVIGYVLGKGDVEIVDADATLTPGETTYYIHLLPSRPGTPHKGDAFVDGGVWWFYNGEAWVTLGGTFAGNGWAQYPQSLGGDGKWHRVIIANGALAYDEQGFDEPPDAAPFALKSELTAETERATAAEQAKVPTDGDHTINGVKTFAQSPLVPTIQSTDENSQKAASTGWVSSKITAWWNAIKSTVTFTKAQVGLGNVDNTSDANKPISTATQTALNAKADSNAVVKLQGSQLIIGSKTFEKALSRVLDFIRDETVRDTVFQDQLVSINDRDGTLVGYIQVEQQVAGHNGISFGIRKMVNGEELTSKFIIEITSDGKRRFRSTDGNFGISHVYAPAFAAAGMPSGSRIDRSLPQSGTGVSFNDYSGWLVFGRRATAAGQFISLQSSRARMQIAASEAGQDLILTIPVSKGDTVVPTYTANGETLYFYISRSNAENA